MSLRPGRGAGGGESAPAEAGLHIYVSKGAQVSGDIIANTGAATKFEKSQFTLPYRSLQEGSRLNIMARGIWSSAAAAPSMTTDLVFNVSGVDAVVATTGSVLQSLGVSDQGWELEADLICRVEGESGRCDLQGHRVIFTGPRSSQREDLENSSQNVFFNTKMPVAISLQQTWSVASGTNSIEMTQFSATLWGPA